ncbi:MAG TPA: class I SAM-dependent methyltransferase [Patescibacteria group bacterium]
MDLKDTYNKIAKDWNKDHKIDTWWNVGTVKFTSYLKKGDSILDVGCAGGMKSEFLANQGFAITGIDLSDEMIKIAKDRMPNGEFYVKDITQPLGLDNQFDGVFAQAVLLHISKKDIRKVLKNLLNVLKTGGHLYIAVKQLREGEKDEQVVQENDYGYEYERFFSFYTLPELERYMKEFDMEIVFSDITRNGNTDWIQIIAKKV